MIRMLRPTALPSLVVALLLGTALAMAPRAAAALEVPNIDGHMTDPQHKLGGAKTGIEERFEELQQETHVDVAGWITDAPEDQVEALGAAAYERWKIGHDWDNGLFFIFPSAGPVHVIQNRATPELTVATTVKLAAADDPHAPLPDRIASLTKEAQRLLFARTQKVARPPGTGHPERGRYYAIVAAALALAAISISLRRRKGTPTP